MSLYLAVKRIYPSINNKDFTVYDDGTGEVILHWNSELPQPTLEELKEVEVDALLDSDKQIKKLELNRECNATILGRFSSVVDGVEYYFSNDMEAQANFEKCDRAFEKGRLTELAWTCYDVDGGVVRLVLTPETFEKIYIDHLMHIQNNISKFRDFLMPMVDSATSEEDLKKIQWNQPEIEEIII